MNRKRFALYLVVGSLFLPYLITHLWMFVKIWPWPDLLPRSWGLRGWAYFFNPSSRSLVILGNSILLSAVVTLLTLLVCFPAAKALGSYEFRGKRLINGLILLPVIVPILTVAMGIHVSFIKMGLANTVWGVILIHMIPGIPYGVRILQNIFQIHGRRLEMQARLLGAHRFQVFFHITVPLVMPGLITAGSMIYIISFSQYVITFLIGGGNVITFSMQMFPFIEAGDRTVATVFSFIFVLSILLVLTVSEKLVRNYYQRSSETFL